MKKVQINYSFSNGQTFDVSGINADQAYRQLTDIYDKPILDTKGRLTQAQFIERCKLREITINVIRVNGKAVYLNGDSKNVQPVQTTQPAPSNTEIDYRRKFMYARFKSTCSETGNTINKGDLMFYIKDTKSTYCMDSPSFRQAVRNKDYRYELALNTPSKPTNEPEPKPEPTPEVIEVVESKPEPQKVNGHSQKSSANGQGWEFMAEQIKPYLNLNDNLDYERITEQINAIAEKMTRKLEIKINDKPIIKIDGQHYAFEDLLQFVAQRINVLIVGPAGSGKTHAAKEVSKVLNLDFYSISVGSMTTKTDFMGYMDANGNYVETNFRRAFENGGIYLLDEMDAGNANVLTTINMALANGECAFPDGMVEKHEDFVLIAGANTYGNGADRQYVGRNQLDAATLNRFAVIDWGYDEKLELAISSNERWTKYVQAIRKNCDRLKLRYVISPRQSITGGQMLDAGMSIEKVEKYILFKGMNQSDESNLKSGIKY